MKIVVPYQHDSADLSTIYLAVVPDRNRAPYAREWLPAYRDMFNQQPVVWAKFEQSNGIIWVRDREGDRIVKKINT